MLGEVEQQVEDLRLHRDVERAHGLVGDQQLGLRREAARDRDPLALAAGELAREAARERRREADEVEQLATFAVASSRSGDAVHAQRLGDRRAHRHARVQRRERILEDDLDPPPHAAAAPCRSAP